jgi:hypothetical protein
MPKLLVEGFDYHDLTDQVVPEVDVDEYAAKMGDDDEIVTLSFIVNSKQAGEDLVEWFELGYEFVLNSQVSEGELSPGKFLVFVELSRRTSVPERIVQLIEDLETLTDIPLSGWKIRVKDVEYPADITQLARVISLSPAEYRKKNKKENDLNEMRNLSGIASKKIYGKPDSLLRDFISKAGL